MSHNHDDDLAFLEPLIELIGEVFANHPVWGLAALAAVAGGCYAHFGLGWF